MKQPFAISILSMIASLGFAEPTDTSLADKIAERKAASSKKANPEKKAIYKKGIDMVAESGIVENAIQEGDIAPDFTLKNHLGEEVTLSEQLKKGPVVLTWYRGGWCPYCNIQLAAYQEILPELKEQNAQLIAISPEVPDKSLGTVESNKLAFTVLSDLNLTVAKQYNIVFKLYSEVGKIYKGFFDIKEYNGEEAAEDELPLAATYVINTDGKVVYSFLDADYTARAEPAKILEVVKSLK